MTSSVRGKVGHTLADSNGLTVAILVLVLLDLAALDDITTGTQPHFYVGWVMLGLTAPLSIGCGWRWRRLQAPEPDESRTRSDGPF